jgi:phage portal protein BeeE
VSWIEAVKARLQTSPKNVPTSSVAMLFQERGRVGRANVRLFRHWSEHSEWVRTAINIRKAQVSAAEWDIVPFDTDGKEPSKELAARIKLLFDVPNPRADSFRTFIEPIVEDLLVLDAGTIEKVRTLRGMPGQLWAVDGGTIKINALWDGDEAEPRYFWYPDGFERASFTNDELVYMMENPATYRVVGLSKLETLKLAIDGELAGSAYNQRQVVTAAPDGMLDLGEGVRPEQVEEFKSYWHTEVEGKGAMAFIGGSKNAKFVPFRPNNRDMQFLEWQNYLLRKIAGVFGLAPQDLNLTADVNRATADVQQENTEDRGLRPLLALIQDYLTREIVWDDAFGGPDNNLAFRFTRLNLKETTSKAKINQVALAGVPWKSVNEARKEDGREPWGTEFNEPLMVTPTGVVRLTELPTARELFDQQKRDKQPAGPNGKPAGATSGSGSKGNAKE